MSGMGGRGPGPATSVTAAFHALLLHQATFACLLVAIALAASLALPSRRWRRRRSQRTSAERPQEPPGRRLLRLGFGATWFVDGLLQVQKAMPLGLPSEVVRPSASGSAHWVVQLVGFGASAWAQHPVSAAVAAVWVQIGIAVMLLLAPSGWPSRLAGAVGAAWALVVWVFGEAFGGIFAPGLSWLFGAPGAAVLYLAAGALVALPAKEWSQKPIGRYVLGAAAVFFIGMATLQAWPGRGFWQGRPAPNGAGALTSMVRSMAQTPQPAALSRLLGSFGTFVSAHGWGVNLFVVVTLAAAGAGLLSGRRQVVLAAVTAGVVLCLADWVLVQDLGFLGGIGTDPNSMVPTALVLIAGYLAWGPRALPSRAPALADNVPNGALSAYSAPTRALPGSAVAVLNQSQRSGTPSLLDLVAGPITIACGLGIVTMGAIPLASAAVGGRSVPGLDLATHWGLTPLALAALVALAAHEAGLWRLRAAHPAPRRSRQLRAWAFRGGIATVLVASASPLAYWGMRSLSVHMVGHILLMCFAPAVLVWSGPLVPLCWALPVRPRRQLLRWLRSSRTGAWLRRSWDLATRPLTGFVALNAAMLAWHVPATFDAAMASARVHGLLMEPSFVVAGILFWRSILPSHPYQPRARLRDQFAMVVGTNFEMVVLAMALSIFTSHAWYTMGPGTPAQAFSAQQSAAAILWICGDFWALPAVVIVMLRVIKRDGSLLSALERRLGAGAGQPDDAGYPPAAALSAGSSLGPSGRAT